MASIAKNKDGQWTFTCSTCGEESQEYPTRKAAREAYRIHREELCSGKPEAKSKPQPKKKEKKATPKKDGDSPLPIFRIGEAVSARTGRTSIVEVTKTGSLVPTDVKRLSKPGGKKVKKVPFYHEVRAASRTEARELIAAGKAKKVKVK